MKIVTGSMAVFIIFCWAVGLHAEEITDVQEVPPGTLWNPEMFPELERTVNLLNTHTTRKYALLISIDHRTFERFTSNTFRDWFGLDAGSLKIGIGLRFGILDDLDVGVLRLNGTGEIFDVYQFDARYRLLTQQKHFVNLAFRTGVTWFYQPSIPDAAGFLGQILVDRTFFDRLTVGAGLLYHSDSSGAMKSNRDREYSLAVGTWIEVRILSFLVWNIEMTAPVAGYFERYPALSSAVKFITNRHVFMLVLTNTQYLSDDGIVAGTYRSFNDLIVGFTILREIDF
jgi:hypothetical protein